jgi:tetratricopeptide (TPR) repeat protein
MFLIFFLGGCATAPAGPAPETSRDLPELVRSIQESVVTVITYDTDGTMSGQGTGFFVDREGHLITNYHVMAGAYSAEIRTRDGKTYRIESVVSEKEEVDLVKVRVRIPESGVRWVTVSGQAPEVAERILVVGSPLGLEQTVSEGIVSAVREIPEFGKVFQLSAPISPGSSGSPVVDRSGKVVGVVSFQTAIGQNLNFAISGKEVLALEKLESTVTVAQWTFSKSSGEPEVAEELCRKGVSFALRGEFKEALEFYKDAAEKKPGDADALYGLGHCYAGLDQTVEAIEAYSQVIRNNPEDPSAHFTLGSYYSQIGRSEEAIASFREALKIDSEFAPARYEMGALLGRLGRMEEAIAAYEAVIQMSPLHSPSYLQLGVILGKLGRYEEAVQTLTKLIALHPDSAPIRYQIGVMYRNLGNIEEEETAYKAAIQVDPDFAPAHYGMGDLFLRAGEKGKALEEYKILKELDPIMAKALFERIYG